MSGGYRIGEYRVSISLRINRTLIMVLFKIESGARWSSHWLPHSIASLFFLLQPFHSFSFLLFHDFSRFPFQKGSLIPVNSVEIGNLEDTWKKWWFFFFFCSQNPNGGNWLRRKLKTCLLLGSTLPSKRTSVQGQNNANLTGVSSEVSNIHESRPASAFFLLRQLVWN